MLLECLREVIQKEQARNDQSDVCVFAPFFIFGRRLLFSDLSWIVEILPTALF